jgi:hypothetical protein
MPPSTARPVRLRFEELEARELLSAGWAVETFENAAARALPAGWGQWNAAPSAAFRVTDGAGFGSANGLVTAGNAAGDAGRVWQSATYEKDVQVQADVYLGSSGPLQLFARGRDLDTMTPTFYAVSVGRGGDVTLERVVRGKVTELAKVDSADWVANSWLRIRLAVRGDHLGVQVFRTDTAQYLTTDGTWQSAPASAIDAHDSAIGSAGRVGLDRPTTTVGRVAVDNFAVSTAAPVATPAALEQQYFSNNLVRGLPAGWGSYTNTTGQSFQVAANSQAPTGSSTVSVTGATGLVARAWYDATLPADVQVSASLYLNSLAPAQIFARGQNLGTDSPDYYAVSITRGATVQLVSVLDGRTTVLGSVTTNAWTGQQWVQVTLSVTGTTLRAQVYRADTGQYLTSDGQWQVAPAWALVRTDSAIRGAGKAGIGRASGASGTVSFDNFVVTTAAAPGGGTTGGSGTGQPGQGKTQTFTFDGNTVGTIPPAWVGWSQGGGGFQVTAQPSLTSPHGLTSTGASDASARAWYTGQVYGDMLLSGSIYVDGLAPAELFARGQQLNTSHPSYYAVSVTRGLDVSLVVVNSGKSRVLASVGTKSYLSNLWVTATFRVVAGTLQVFVYRQDTKQYLGGDGLWHDSAVAAITKSDGTLTAGYAGVNRPASYKGRVLFDTLSFVDLSENVPTTPPPVDPPGPVVTPPAGGGGTTSPGQSHYPYVRIAELAYYGTPIGDFELNLLKNSVDLIVANPVYLDQIAAAAPGSTRLIYTNVSNIYLDLLTDWLAYADKHGLDREGAFYHVTQATPFTGDSSSSRPVNWFWSVQVGGAAGWTDFTRSARQNAQNFSFGDAGESVVVGYTDKFREMNFRFDQGASGGWAGVVEYATAVDAAGNPTAWATLKTIADTTNGFHKSGTITFDPPADWKTAAINGSDSLFYVRIRTTHAGAAPVAATVLGRDYVRANGTTSGIIPAFDYAADKNGDGYLSDAEYAHRRAGMDARFAYEGRLFYGSYGQMRFATNPSDAGFRAWAADYTGRYLAQYPNAGGLFVDNSYGRLPANPGTLAESLANYAADYGSLLGVVNAAVGPKWVLANTAGAGASADPIVKNGVSYLEEFGLRPLASNFSQFEDAAAQVEKRLTLSGGKGYAVLDTYPAGGAPTDARTQIAALAEYYLVADPKKTFVMFNGGFEPATGWNRHWTDALKFNVGQPQGTWSLFATGADPAKRTLTYKVYERQFQNALVLYKPLSYKLGVGNGTLAEHTATTHKLNGTYRLLNADGTLSGPVTSVTLRNGEGAILVKA